MDLGFQHRPPGSHTTMRLSLYSKPAWIDVLARCPPHNKKDLPGPQELADNQCKHSSALLQAPPWLRSSRVLSQPLRPNCHHAACLEESLSHSFASSGATASPPSSVASWQSLWQLMQRDPSPMGSSWWAAVGGRLRVREALRCARTLRHATAMEDFLSLSAHQTKYISSDSERLSLQLVAVVLKKQALQDSPRVS